MNPSVTENRLDSRRFRMPCYMHHLLRSHTQHGYPYSLLRAALIVMDVKEFFS